MIFLRAPVATEQYYLLSELERNESLLIHIGGKATLDLLITKKDYRYIVLCINFNVFLLKQKITKWKSWFRSNFSRVTLN
jgi:hypothetical protein